MPWMVTVLDPTGQGTWGDLIIKEGTKLQVTIRISTGCKLLFCACPTKAIH